MKHNPLTIIKNTRRWIWISYHNVWRNTNCITWWTSLHLTWQMLCHILMPLLCMKMKWSALSLWGKTQLSKKADESSSKSPESKRKEYLFSERCLWKLKENSKILLDSLKSNDDIKMTLLMSMKTSWINWLISSISTCSWLG